MNNAIAATFLLVVTRLGGVDLAVTCDMPTVIFDSDLITKSCQSFTLPKHNASSCYVPATKQVILPDSCDSENPDEYCMRLIKHEFDRYIEQVCLRHTFNNIKEPQSVLDAEEFE